MKHTAAWQSRAVTSIKDRQLGTEIDCFYGAYKKGLWTDAYCCSITVLLSVLGTYYSCNPGSAMYG